MTGGNLATTAQMLMAAGEAFSPPTRLSPS